jgi:hypothetical protein
MIMCPSCGKLHENERGKCPFCDWGLYSHTNGKHAVKQRDLIAKHSCPHKILLCMPCPKCERYAGEDCEAYERSMLVELQKLYLDDGTKRSEAWTNAKNLLAAIRQIKDRPK